MSDIDQYLNLDDPFDYMIYPFEEQSKKYTSDYEVIYMDDDFQPEPVPQFPESTEILTESEIQDILMNSGPLEPLDLEELKSLIEPENSGIDPLEQTLEHKPIEVLPSDQKKDFLRCKYCDRAFVRIKFLMRHEASHVKKEPKECKQCGKTFVRNTSLRQHLATHKSPYRCKHCNQIYSSLELFENHLKGLEEQFYRCKHCTKTFLSHSGYKSHHRRHIQSDTSLICTEECKQDEKSVNWQPFSCSWCGKSFYRQHNLTIHERSHNNPQTYRCRHCSLTFTSSRNLTMHEKKHTVEHKCERCNKIFSTSKKLKIHEKIHDDETRLLTCKYCKNIFSDPLSLGVHERIHTSSRSYSCTYCQKNFNSISMRRVHELTCKIA